MQWDLTREQMIKRLKINRNSPLRDAMGSHLRANEPIERSIVNAPLRDTVGSHLYSNDSGAIESQS